MSNAKFDILFAGETLPGADPAEVRRRVQAIFKVSEEATERLFSGAPVAVKRAVDAETSRRYDALFREAGALVRIAPVASEGGGAVPSAPRPASPAVEAARDAPAPEVSRLGLAPPGGAPLEPAVSDAAPTIDLSHLSLVEGDWDLADCSRPPPPVAVPDIDHLRLVPAEDEGTREQVGSAL